MEWRYDGSARDRYVDALLDAVEARDRLATRYADELADDLTDELSRIVAVAAEAGATEADVDRAIKREGLDRLMVIATLLLSIAGHATAVTWGHIEVGSATNRTYGIWSCGVNSSTNISLNIPVTGLTGDSLSIIVDSGSNYPQAILLTYIES